MTVSQVDLSSLYDSNIYFVDGGERTLLMDTGTGFNPDPSIASIRRLLAGRELDYLVLTHRHFDHVGGMGRVIREFSPREVMIGEKDAEPIRNGDSEATLGTRFGGTIGKTEAAGLRDGDGIDLGEYVLTVVETPGHTIGSVCLHEREKGILFSGDTFFVNGVGNTTDPTGSADMLAASLRRLSGLEIEGLYPGHGPYLTKGGREQLGAAMRMMGA